MSRERRFQRFPFVPGVALWPEDFGVRLTRLKQVLAHALHSASKTARNPPANSGP